MVATSALAACTLTLGDSWSSGIPEAAAANDPLIDLLNPFADLSPSAPNPILGHRESLAAGEQTQASNDIVALSINASAGAELVDAALADATADPALAMSEALGTQLGPLFAEALQHGDLPKTSSLLNEGLRDGLANPSNAKAHFAYKRPFIRLGFADQGGHLTRTSSPEYAKLAKDGSFPSGHTINGYLAGTALATLLPEFGPQLLARASQFAHHRIVLAMHYPLDVMGGRMAAQRVLQARWSNAGSREVLDDAAAELRSVLTSRCQTAGHGPDLKACASAGTAYLSTEAAVAVYTERLTYGLGSVLPVTAPCGGEGSDQLVAAIPPGAEDLLLTAAPSLDASGRRALLAATAAAPGSPLDTRTGQGS
ncbi:MAG: phosphatase PAP2 family protein, partial [Bifidobacteriaceae bacterium]|nr:phosphatase PAP2 family protein [Bifidobacteriaceae bacterium]